MRKHLIAVGLLLIAVITACSPASTNTSTSATSAPLQTSTPSPLEAVARSGADRPAWLSTPLINAETGATFTLADFPGKTVYVEFMATWCTNCRIQQGNVRTVRTQLSADDYVFISLSVEPKDTTPALGQYMKTYSYPWTFAIVPKDMMVALIGQFGQTVTNPTATPHVIINPEGAITQLSTGIRSPDQLTAELKTAASA